MKNIPWIGLASVMFLLPTSSIAASVNDQFRLIELFSSYYLFIQASECQQLGLYFDEAMISQLSVKFSDQFRDDDSGLKEEAWENAKTAISAQIGRGELPDRVLCAELSINLSVIK